MSLGDDPLVPEAMGMLSSNESSDSKSHPTLPTPPAQTFVQHVRANAVQGHREHMTPEAKLDCLGRSSTSQKWS